MRKHACLLLFAASLLSAQAPKIPLEGLDPVALIHGQTLDGDKNFSVVRGRFQYLFANAANKATFEKDPARYEIQLEGACARMGPRTGGSPDLYTVHDGRIYVFGSAECKSRFEAAPAKYLERPAPVALSTDASAVEAARKLLTRAVEAMGGPAALEAMQSFRETREQNAEIRTVVFPNNVTVRRTYQGKYTVEEVTEGDAGFTSSGGARRDFTRAAARDAQQDAHRDPATILWAIQHHALRAAAISDHVVDTEWTGDHARMILLFDPGNGRIAGIKYVGRGPGGEIGEIEQRFSDYRASGGLRLPFKIDALFNGQPAPGPIATVTAFVVNPPAQ